MIYSPINNRGSAAVPVAVMMLHNMAFPMWCFGSWKRNLVKWTTQNKLQPRHYCYYYWLVTLPASSSSLVYVPAGLGLGLVCCSWCRLTLEFEWCPITSLWSFTLPPAVVATQWTPDQMTSRNEIENYKDSKTPSSNLLPRPVTIHYFGRVWAAYYHHHHHQRNRAKLYAPRIKP